MARFLARMQLLEGAVGGGQGALSTKEGRDNVDWGVLCGPSRTPQAVLAACSQGRDHLSAVQSRETQGEQL